MTIAVREALAYIHRTFDVPVPAGVLSTLESTPTAFPERILYQGRTAGGLPPWQAARASLREWKGGSCSPTEALTALSRYFQDLWYVPGLWQHPGHAVLRATRKAVGRPRVLSPMDFVPAAARAGNS